jgi:hypothetical protein
MEFSAIHRTIASLRNRQSDPIRKAGILPCRISLQIVDLWTWSKSQISLREDVLIVDHDAPFFSKVVRKGSAIAVPRRSTSLSALTGAFYDGSKQDFQRAVPI